MAQSYLDKEGLLYFLQKIRPDSTPLMDGTASTGTAKRFANQDHVHPSDTSKADKSSTVSNVTWDSTNKKLKKTINGTTTDVVTLATVATSGSYNDLSNKPTIPTLKNNFGKVKVGTTTIEADTTQDTLELEGGTNITLTPDATNDKVTIAFSGTIPTVPNNFGTVKVGSTSIVADTTSDTLELVAGSNITLTPDATNDKVTIKATNTTYSDFTGATSSAAGTHGLVPAPQAGEQNEVLYGDGQWRGQTIAYGILPDESNLYLSIAKDGQEMAFPTATTSRNGLMSSDDKTKLNGIATGAEVNVQSDWNVTDNTSDAYIKNKPTLGAAAAKGVVTSISAASLNLPTSKAVSDYVSSAVTGAVAYQGIAPTTFAPTNVKAGWYWIVGTAGTYVGQTCEAGDMIFAKAAATTYSASNFDVVQTNLDITAITNAEIDTIVAS